MFVQLACRGRRWISIFETSRSRVVAMEYPITSSGRDANAESIGREEWGYRQLLQSCRKRHALARKGRLPLNQTHACSKETIPVTPTDWVFDSQSRYMKSEACWRWLPLTLSFSANSSLPALLGATLEGNNSLTTGLTSREAPRMEKPEAVSLAVPLMLKPLERAAVLGTWSRSVSCAGAAVIRSARLPVVDISIGQGTGLEAKLTPCGFGLVYVESIATAVVAVGSLVGEQFSAALW